MKAIKIFLKTHFTEPVYDLIRPYNLRQRRNEPVRDKNEFPMRHPSPASNVDYDKYDPMDYRIGYSNSRWNIRYKQDNIAPKQTNEMSFGNSSQIKMEDKMSSSFISNKGVSGAKLEQQRRNRSKDEAAIRGKRIVDKQRKKFSE